MRPPPPGGGRLCNGIPPSPVARKTPVHASRNRPVTRDASPVATQSRPKSREDGKEYRRISNRPSVKRAGRPAGVLKSESPPARHAAVHATQAALFEGPTAAGRAPGRTRDSPLRTEGRGCRGSSLVSGADAGDRKYKELTDGDRLQPAGKTPTEVRSDQLTIRELSENPHQFPGYSAVADLNEKQVSGKTGNLFIKSGKTESRSDADKRIAGGVGRPR
jgi:hypothetical protein